MKQSSIANFASGKSAKSTPRKTKTITDSPIKKKLLKSEPVKKVKAVKNESVPFSLVASGLAEIEKCQGGDSKNRKKDIFTGIFLEIWDKCPSDLILVFYFLLCKIGPDYKTQELGIGNEYLVKCVSKAIGRSDKQVKEELKQIGDLSAIAAENKGKKKSMMAFIKNKEATSLTLHYIMTNLIALSEIKGKNSTSEKEKLILKLLNDSSPNEIKFIIRFIQKKLNIGASYKTVISAFARAVSKKTGTDEKEIDELLVATLAQNSNYDVIFEQIIEIVNTQAPISSLPERCPITPGIPIQPMLAKPTTGVKDIFKRLNGSPFTCEYKYDGYRGHIHCSEGKIGIFSRNLEDTTVSYPDVVAFFEAFNAKHNISSFILDCEILPVDYSTGDILPFAELTKRNKKNVTIDSVKTQVKLYLFDLIYLNGASTCQMSLAERRALLKKAFPPGEMIEYASTLESTDSEEILKFMNQAIKDRCEGLIIKKYDDVSVYVPGARDFNWLKLKKDYLEESTIGDSLDLVPIGAVYGEGKRTGVFGSYLLACYDDDGECFEAVSMIGTGLKDDQLSQFYDFFANKTSPEPMANYKVNDTKVDVWFSPEVVWEVKTADLSLSPKYCGAMNLTEDGRGISLRFPRLIRVRTDKKPEEATTSEQVLSMFKSQSAYN